MRRLTIRALVALLAFACGLALAELWGEGQISDVQPAKDYAREAPAPKSATQPITFKSTGSMVMWKVTYLSSDGVSVRYGCFDSESAAYPPYGLPDKHPTKQGYVEWTPKFDETGKRVGARLVTAWPEVGRELDAHISWTEGPRISYIDAPSLKHARLFEESRAWAGQGCVSFESTRRESQPAAQPNKSFEPTAR